MWIRIVVVLLALSALAQIVAVRRGSPLRERLVVDVPIRGGDSIPDFDVSPLQDVGAPKRGMTWKHLLPVSVKSSCRVLVLFTGNCPALASFAKSWQSVPGPNVPELWVALYPRDTAAVQALARNRLAPPLAYVTDARTGTKLGIDYVPVALLLDRNDRVVGFPRSRMPAESVAILCPFDRAK